MQTGWNQLIVRPWLPFKVARCARQLGDLRCHPQCMDWRTTGWLRCRGFPTRLLGEHGQFGELQSRAPQRVGRNHLVTLPWLPCKVARYDTASLVTSGFTRVAAPLRRWLELGQSQLATAPWHPCKDARLAASLVSSDLIAIAPPAAHKASWQRHRGILTRMPGSRPAR